MRKYTPKPGVGEGDFGIGDSIKFQPPTANFQSLLLPIRVLIHQCRQDLNKFVALFNDGILRRREETALPEYSKPVPGLIIQATRRASIQRVGHLGSWKLEIGSLESISLGVGSWKLVI